MSTGTDILERHLLLQLGERLRALRKARGMTAVQMADLAGITRTTLRAVESGDPASAIGTYLRVMSVLGLSGELALLAGDTFLPAPPGSAAARSKRPAPVVKVEIVPSAARHQLQDLQSLALHAEAVRLIKKDPELAQAAQRTLADWMATQPESRAMSLWREWSKVLTAGTWRKVLGPTARAQQLRQASPLGAVLPDEVRQRVLQQVASLKRGVVIDGALETAASGLPGFGSERYSLPQPQACELAEASPMPPPKKAPA